VEPPCTTGTEQLVAGGHVVKNCGSKWLNLVKGGCVGIPQSNASV